jgi:predicted ATPase
MIHELTIRSPKKTPIPHWQNVAFLKKAGTIEFQPGLNVLFGANGSGKSTLINALAMLMHCKLENWPRVTKESLGFFNRPIGYADGLLLSHDGMPARYMGIESGLGFIPERNIKVVDVNAKDLKNGDAKGKALHNMSAGQATMSMLIQFLHAEPKKTIYKFKTSQCVGEWKDIHQVGTESLKNVVVRDGLPQQGVLLLDEIDRSVDLVRQAAIWQMLRRLSTTYQIIIASHSPFCLTASGAHYIETSEDALVEARQALKQLVPESDIEAVAATQTMAAAEA